MRVLDFSDGFSSNTPPTLTDITAADVPNVPSGNVSSTDVQSAINELQTDIDTRQLASATLAIAHGGTGQTSKAPAFDALQPMSAPGDVIYGGASGTGTRLPKGGDGQVLTLASGLPSWATPGTTTGLYAKNFLVNSGFDYFQAGQSITVTATGGGSPTNSYGYVADQWYVKNILGGGTVEGIITAQPNTLSSSSVPGINNALQVKITTAPTGTGIQNGCELWQVLSAKATQELYNNNASFSVLVHGLGNVNQVGIQFFYATSETKPTVAIGSEVLTTVPSSSSSTALCTINGQALGTSMTTTGVIGVRIRITGVSSGNTYDLNNGFTCGQPMLNLGPTASPFQRQYNDPTAELAACRYFLWVPLYNTSVDTSTAGPFGVGQCLGTTQAGIFLKTPVPMRIPPTFSATNLSDLSILSATSALITVTSLVSGTLQTEGGSLVAGVASGLVAGNATFLLRNINTSSVLTFDARI